MNLVIFQAEVNRYNISHMQLILPFYADAEETLQVFRLWSEDVHIVRI